MSESKCLERLSYQTSLYCFISGALVISAYAVCPDITATVTPDLEDPDGKGQFLPRPRLVFFFPSLSLSLSALCVRACVLSLSTVTG